ncbi:hypothetical protein EDB85DRAFT_303073 [Lactarius pseudohatsudake]|nr:hypothetical protein EDB85DRAFT_303073 [Lactarius pseudohatsudake]
MLKRVIQKKEGIPLGTPHMLMSFLHLITILVDHQRLISHHGRQMEDSSTLSSYGIQEADIIYLVRRLRGGGGAIMGPLAYAHAIVFYDWDGDMVSRSFTGICYRGITSKRRKTYQVFSCPGTETYSRKRRRHYRDGR